jgi:2-keto-3-deoxy-L-fuconate dehydrogenase
MSQPTVAGKRILVTHADQFMGPTLCEVLTEHGATVIASTDALLRPDAPAALIAKTGHIDVLIANLAIPAPATSAVESSDAEWHEVFAAIVDPLPRLFRAVLPAMIARRSGKIVVLGSASALRGMKRASTYSAARGAQLSYAQAVGVEVAPHNVKVNAIAQRRTFGTPITVPIPHCPRRAGPLTVVARPEATEGLDARVDS